MHFDDQNQDTEPTGNTTTADPSPSEGSGADQSPRPSFQREEGSEAPRSRPERPRNERSFSPRPNQARYDRPRSDRPRDDRPRFDRGDRPRYERDDRPRDDRPRDDRPRFDRSDRPRYERPDRPRDDRPRDDRPRFDRDDRPRDDRPRFDRGDRPRYERDDRPRDERPRDERPRFERSERPRFERDERPRDDRPRYDRDERPRDDRPREERPRFERSERPRFERDDRPRDDRPREDRPRFDRDERPRDDRPREERPRFERSERPRFQRDQRPRDERPRDERPKPERPAKKTWNEPGVFKADMPVARPEGEERPEGGLALRSVEAYKALMNLVLEVGSEYGLTRAEDFRVDDLVVPVKLLMRKAPGDETTSDVGPEGLVKELRDRIATAVTAHNEFRTGAVYCFQCESSSCAHAFPEHMGDTFSGYTATGKPEWKGFANIFLEARDGRIEKVYGDHPEILALVQSADELKGDLLPGFGKGSLVYNVLGQVVAGLVPLDMKLTSLDSPRTAVTLQVVETRSLSAKHRLRLNMLGLSVDQLAAASETQKGRTAAVRLQNVLRDVRTQLEALSHHVEQLERRGENVAIETWVAPLLRRLQGDLERTLRTSPVRSMHAEERHLEGERPTAVALKDAVKASMDKYFIDTRHDTIVVLGPRLRAHVFGRDGTHVTSMQLEPGELERKTGKGVWIPAPTDQSVVFQSALRARIESTENQAE